MTFAAGLLVLLPVACSRDEKPSASTREDDAASDAACLVAEGRGFSITIADAEALRHSYIPPLGAGDATRLAVDVWLAEGIATGAIGKLPLRDRITLQQRLAVEHGPRWPQRLSEAADEFVVRHGPCWVPPSKREDARTR